jgi:spore coat protein H
MSGPRPMHSCWCARNRRIESRWRRWGAILSVMKSTCVHRVFTKLLALCFAWPSVLFAAGPGDELFTNGLIHRLQITIPTENISALRTNAREYVHATIRDGTNVYPVGIHLKGSVGSFRGIDGKPGLTISFDKFMPEQRFLGLRKIHLNNSVEDPSYMNELIGNELFRAAGVPAPRVTHGLVELNGRPLGLYVLKEGFAEEFLARYFRHPDGNLYDIARDGHDVDEQMEKALGRGPNDRSDLDALTAAAVEPDLDRRLSSLQRVLDLDRFISFMAMEILLGHRDGYCLARNNFRVYEDVDSGRMVFFPHGMDVLFGNARALVQPVMKGLVARAITEVPEGKRTYRGRCSLLLTNVFKLEQINSRIDAALAQLRPVLDHDAATALEREAAALKQRIASRVADAGKQLQQAPLELLRFQDQTATVTGWQPMDVPAGGSLVQTNAADGKNVLAIHAGPVTSASWRAKVLLSRGKYRFEALARTIGAEPLKFGKNHGATLRVVGATFTRPSALLRDTAWTKLQAPLEVTEKEKEVELVCELRASKGTATFDLPSLRIVREQ